MGIILQSNLHFSLFSREMEQFSSFSFPFIFISWRLITLQHCSGFCHTLTWINHGFTCVPHPEPPPTYLPPHSSFLIEKKDDSESRAESPVGGVMSHEEAVQFSSVTQSCPTLRDPTNRSTPGLPVHH